MTTVTIQLDLFGDEFAQPPPIERFLAEYDEHTRHVRGLRFEHVDSVYPMGTWMTSVSVSYLLQEARSTFVNGDYAATILVAQACIEHLLKPHVMMIAGPQAERWGLARMVRLFRERMDVPAFLLDRIDRLRAIRNPFVHMRLGDDDALEWRSYRDGLSLERRIYLDAREALGLMYTVAVRLRDLLLHDSSSRAFGTVLNFL